MRRDISVANRDALLGELALYQNQLVRLQQALQNNDAKELFELFSNAQAARHRWEQSIENT